jgi:sec-independent protein translocase protein TatA
VIGNVKSPMFLSPFKIFLIVVLLLVLFGGGRLSSVGKGLGEGIRNFKKALEGDGKKGK